MGAPVAGAAALTGGYSSRMLGLTHVDGRETVLRQLLLEPWRRHAAGLLNREAEVQTMLAGSPVGVPEPLAVDPDGQQVGDPSLLMSRLPGAIDLVRHDDDFLAAPGRDAGRRAPLPAGGRCLAAGLPVLGVRVEAPRSAVVEG